MNKAQREAQLAAEKLADEQRMADAKELPASKPTTGPTVDQLMADLAKANAKLEKFGVGQNIEEDVRLRMDLGLDREQAITCARRQSAHEKVLATKWNNETDKQTALNSAASLG